MDLKKGVKAVADLEANASRLSQLIPKLEEVESTLTELRKAEINSKNQLKQYEKNLSKLEGQLTESIQIKLAEGLAEVSSRTKDIYDQNLTEKSKMKSSLRKINDQMILQVERVEEMDTNLGKLSDEMSKGHNALKETLFLLNAQQKKMLGIIYLGLAGIATLAGFLLIT